MIATDSFCTHYSDILDNTYDCVDRIVLNAYFPLGQSPGGFRIWWRQLMDSDQSLDNTQLMRFSGRFSRRVRKVAEKRGIPLIDCRRGDRKHEMAEQLIPTAPDFQGVFCILVSRAPAPLWEVKKFDSGAIDIRRKATPPFVNYYSFHIIDAEWGHVTIKLCPHPPFNAMIMLNGHEYVARQAQRAGLKFTKEGNCFTHLSNAAGLTAIADTMRDSGSEGRLAAVCNRWIYSSCLCYALDSDAQRQSGFRYNYSIYQAEYSRNLLFERGRVMDQVFQAVIDRSRAPLDMPIVKTIFGYKQRPYQKKINTGRFQVSVETPAYTMTVFKVHFGKLTVKMYSKGERVLRVEAVVHNTKELRCGRVLEKFPDITQALKSIVDHFLDALHPVDVRFIDLDTLQSWSTPSTVGHVRVGGLDINSPRIQSVMTALITLSPQPNGFTSSDLAQQVREIMKLSPDEYTARQAAYDLKKFRGKSLVQRIGKSRRYECQPKGLKCMTAFLTIRQKVLIPLVENAGHHKRGLKPKNQLPIDTHYYNIQNEMKSVFKELNIAA